MTEKVVQTGIDHDFGVVRTRYVQSKNKILTKQLSTVSIDHEKISRRITTFSAH